MKLLNLFGENFELILKQLDLFEICLFYDKDKVQEAHNLTKKQANLKQIQLLQDQLKVLTEQI